LSIVYLPFRAGGGFELTTKVAVLLNQCVTQTKPFYHISVVMDCRYLLPLLDCIMHHFTCGICFLHSIISSCSFSCFTLSCTHHLITIPVFTL